LQPIAFHHQPLSCGNAEITATARATPPENRLHGSIGMIPPVEFEQAYYAALNREPQPV
jgi:hypothetical protein